MSPAPKPKSKDRSTPKAVKEQSKLTMKSFSPHSNAGNGLSAIVYNPALRTFLKGEIPDTLFSAPQSNVRFRSVDDPDDNSGSSSGNTVEYDALSNHDSCSGESEDQREKPTSLPSRIDAIPGGDNDRRDKIRQRNERKHQRQRERRARELHECCCALLISRKLEALSSQLVAMGFPADRATTALIMNAGRMEETLASLLHEGEEHNRQQSSAKLEDKTHMEIDITDELARIAEFVIKYKCTEQEVERAVVFSEGDLSKAEENLVLQKISVTAVMTQKLDESIDSIESNGKVTSPNQSPVLLGGATTGTSQQLRQYGRDLNHLKSMAPKILPQDSANNNLQQSVERIQPNTKDWSRDQVAAADRMWLTMSSAPSVSYPLAPRAQVSGAQIKSEPLFGLMMGNELHRPKQNLPPSSINMRATPPQSTVRYSSVSPTLDILAAEKAGLVHNLASMAVNGSNLQHLYPQNSVPVELSASAGWNGHSWNASGGHSSLAMPSSLGLFSGRSCAKNGWNTSVFPSHRDYTSVDWSLDLTPLRPPLKSDLVSKTWPKTFMGGNTTSHLTNGADGAAHLFRGQEGGGLMADASASSSLRGWSNPFEGRDLLRVPRQYVTSPSP